jgi:hypothetical protein
MSDRSTCKIVVDEDVRIKIDEGFNKKNKTSFGSYCFSFLSLDGNRDEYDSERTKNAQRNT